MNYNQGFTTCVQQQIIALNSLSDRPKAQAIQQTNSIDTHFKVSDCVSAVTLRKRKGVTVYSSLNLSEILVLIAH